MMQPVPRTAGALRAAILIFTVSSITALCAAPAWAQAPLPNLPQAPPQNSVPTPPPSYPPRELDRLVSPIALYPDPLLAQMLAAATWPADIPGAAQWADQHHYVTGPALTAAIASDQVPWDPSVQSLLPFPSILAMMAADRPWTEELGNAFLAQGPEVMAAVQRMRQQAVTFGYLRSNPQVIVRRGLYIEILPVNPAFIVVPYYDPALVFAPPRRGMVLTGAIRFGFGVSIGAAFAPWGWGTTRFDWGTHAVIINNAPWGRTWTNRATYVHPYTVRRYTTPRPAEQHRAVPRSEREREDERSGRGAAEEHHDDRQRQ